ncbi:futalosine hydrolase [Geomonas sp. RF6]|uniref:futalosine hydrolase n=1 Tax=Geomonas sp. RF6 TaxID=2897342 RepID=UPI001E5AD066|nr:futalosine hydrolase [Geomonas sp. RF6]UFS71592.1 futalosine hydrolase [Geomonas sp. RF6]
MKQIIVTASTLLELSLLLEAIGAVPTPDAGHLRAYRGSFGDVDLLIAVTGMGKVNAASATTLLLERFEPKLLVNTGCAGAFAGSGLGIGDLAIASSDSFGDEGVETPLGWQGLELIGIPVYEGKGARIFNTFPLSPEVAARAVDVAGRGGTRSLLGPFVTVSTCSGTACRGDEILRRFPGTICENMEGAAVAQVATAYGVDLLEVRGISNMVEDRDLSRWDLKGAVAAAQHFLLRFLRQ